MKRKILLLVNGEISNYIHIRVFIIIYSLFECFDHNLLHNKHMDTAYIEKESIWADTNNQIRNYTYVTIMNKVIYTLISLLI